MEYNDLMKQLEAAGTEQTRKTLRRHGVEGDLFGVSYSTFGVLKKKIKTDHDLALKLWASRNHDARIFATMIADPAKLNADLFDNWVKDLRNYVIIDALATVANQSNISLSRTEKWMKSKDEWVGNFGWSLFARAARTNPEFTEAVLEKYIEIIERDIHKAQNRVRHAMNSALISIGVKNDKLQKKALAAAARIGKVEVDHGDTDCKTPDAAQYILK